MPELPEVETIKIGLQKYVVGKTIVDVEVRDSKLITGDVQGLIGGKIIRVRRLAKGIIIDLSNNYSIAFHIKLTGQLIFRDEETKDLLVMKPSPQKVPNKFTRAIIKLKVPHFTEVSRGKQKSKIKTKTQSSKNNNNETIEQLNNEFLYFQEVRGFAWMKIMRTDEVLNLPFFKSLGPEPLVGQTSSGQADLTLEKFEKIIQGSNLPIKALLMDQTKIGGVGNIYANDSCFEAFIDPRRHAKTLSVQEIKKLYDSLLKVLKTGLKYRGSSELNFVDVLGQTGEYQKHVLVYGKKGKTCLRCKKGVIEKIYLAGRGTFYCPVCQN